MLIKIATCQYAERVLINISVRNKSLTNSLPQPFTKEAGKKLQ
ncbi:hypothetical protein S7335_4179 [Synechococcus sp. PCC 7335]|nr:hypothetical protein S7335_4179 [Synechococcus sp. PCC 7335]